MSGKLHNGEAERLAALVRECTIHADRLLTARSRCEPLFPLDSHAYQNLDDDAIANIDHMVYRFTKLQDALGAKLYPALGAMIRPDASRLPYYDVLTTLEKARIVADTDRWMELRTLRNELAHEYDNRPDEGARYLTQLFEAVGELVDAARSAAAYVEEHAFGGGGVARTD